MTEPHLSLPPSLRVRDVAARLAVTPHRVIAWIKSGKLRAMNVAEGTGKKARWRITPEALAEFEASRTVAPPAKPIRRGNKSKSGWQYQYF